MIAFATMLVDAAEQAGMKVPPKPEKFSDYREEYPHFFVFCTTQLTRPVAYHGEHWENAKVIAGLPEERVRKITLEELLSLGYSYKQ